MKYLKKAGKKIKQFGHFLLRNKVHLIPVFLWLFAFNAAIDPMNYMWYQTLGPLVACLFYYVLVLFPGFHAAWKKKYPSSGSSSNKP